jgi:hypothetical protein
LSCYCLLGRSIERERDQLDWRVGGTVTIALCYHRYQLHHYHHAS